MVLRPETLLVGAVTPDSALHHRRGPGRRQRQDPELRSTSRGKFAVSYTVTDVNGNLLFTSTPVTTTLGITSTLTTVDLGNLDTTGYANGTDTITVTVVDQSSQPLPTATGQGSLIIGSPVTVDLTVNQVDQPTGNPTVTNSLSITGSATHRSTR